MKAIKSLRTVRLLLLFAAAASMVGCGYTMKSPYPSDVRTVAVPIWTRGQNVYRRGLEDKLTEALVKRIETDTPYKVVKKDVADSELTGQIKKIEQRILSKNPDTGLPRELEITFYLNFTWKDLRTGENMVEHTNFSIADTYVTAAPIGEEFFEGSEAVINRAARRVVETMMADWLPPEQQH